MSLVAFPRDGLRHFVSQLMGGVECIYDVEPLTFVNPTSQVQAQLSLTNNIMRGVDDRRLAWHPEAVPPTQIETNNGLRSYVLSVRLESYNNTYRAADYLETLRSRIRWQSSSDALNVMNLAVETFENIVNIPNARDTRAVSTAVLDIHFGWAFSDQTDGGGWIATVDGSGIVPGVLSQ